MLKAQGFLPFLLKCYAKTKTFPGFNYEWDDTKHRFFTSKRKPWLLAWTIVIILLVLLNAQVIGNYKKQGQIAKFSIGIILLVVCCTGASMMWFNFVNSESVCKFLNSLLEMEECVIQYDCKRSQSSNSGRKGVHIICTVYLVSAEALAWFAGFGSALVPCSPPNLLAPLNSLCNVGENQGNAGIVTKMVEFILLFLLNGILWKVLTGAGLVACMHVMVGFVGQREFMERIMRKISFDPMLYRKLQLVNIFFNKFHGRMLFALMSTTCVGEACAAYVLFQKLASSKSVNIPNFVAVWDAIVIVDMVVITLYIFGWAGSLHTLSIQTLEKARASTGVMGDKQKIKELRKLLKACPTIRIVFGLSNFIEKQTPIKLFEYSVQRFVDLLLLGKK